MLLLLFVISATLTRAIYNNDTTHDREVLISEEAVVGSVAKLPCDLSTPLPHDFVTLVIWYKNEAKSPIYSLDIRDRSIEQGKHWSDDRTLGNRAYFVVEPPQSFLTIDSVEETDLGTYKCRVDFKYSPTKNYNVNLTVIVPPRKLILVDGAGTTLGRSVVGPVHEGTFLEITCVAVGGWPPPKVSWWRGGTLIDDTAESLNGRRVKNTLLLESITRQHLGSSLLCQAANSPLMSPLTATLVIDIYLGPLDVRLLGSNTPLSANTTYEVTCQSTGSRPPPEISWWKGGKLLQVPATVTGLLSVENEKPDQEKNFASLVHQEYSVRHDVPDIDCKLLIRIGQTNVSVRYYEVNHVGATANQLQNNATRGDGNETTSTINLSVELEDEGMTLSCRASNSHIPGSAIEDSWTLTVHYPPIVSVELGSNLNGSLIREGMDVYFECIVQANPRLKKIQWLHNGVVVTNNASVGTFISNQTLVVQSVSRHSSGAYTCVASNSEGNSHSRPFVLSVKYEPQCRAKQQRVYGAARSEQVFVNCEVDANPSASWFRWVFNNSATQSREVESFVCEGGRSVASHVPLSETDYGTLLCWARNELGSQTVPCVFHIVPAGKPDTPHNCTSAKRSHTWLEISCVQGFDGGLPQQFVAEVRDSTNYVVDNVTNRMVAEFTVTDLEPATSYSVTVYAVNGKGRSGHTHVVVTTLGYDEARLHRRTTESTLTELEPVLLMAICVVLVCLIVVALLFILLLYLQGRRRQQPTEDGNDQLVKRSQYLSTTLSANMQSDDDRNPDIIPHTTDICTGAVDAVGTNTDYGTSLWDIRPPSPYKNTGYEGSLAITHVSSSLEEPDTLSYDECPTPSVGYETCVLVSQTSALREC